MNMNKQTTSSTYKTRRQELNIYHMIDIKENNQIQQTQNLESTVYRNAVFINKPCVYKQTAGFETTQS